MAAPAGSLRLVGMGSAEGFGLIWFRMWRFCLFVWGSGCVGFRGCSKLQARKF